MSEFKSTTHTTQRNAPTEGSGCVIFGLAIILFMIERYLLFNHLGNRAEAGNQFSLQALHFLFGEPPYSVLDVLFGLDFSRDDIFFILQPRNWILLIFQGIHYGLNIVLASAPFWLASSLHSAFQKSNGISIRRRFTIAGIILLPIIITAIIFFSLRSANSSSNTTALSDDSRAKVASTSEECSQSNPAIANWLRDTTPADTLTLAALQVAGDLYSNPRDTGKKEAQDWQQRTTQAYDYMKEYQPIPQCLVPYHNSVTETLLQLSMTFSELKLVYVALDTHQDYEPHLDTAKQSLSSALEASKASVSEWNRLKSLGLFSNESNSPTSSPTHKSSPTLSVEPSHNRSCSKEWVASYLEDVDATMKKATKLADDFGQTQTHEQAVNINKEVSDLFMEVILWNVPECAQEVHLSLLLVITNINTMQQDILNYDMAALNSDFEAYEIAVTQLNTEVIKLGESVK